MIFAARNRSIIKMLSLWIGIVAMLLLQLVTAISSGSPPRQQHKHYSDIGVLDQDLDAKFYGHAQHNQQTNTRQHSTASSTVLNLNRKSPNIFYISFMGTAPSATAINAYPTMELSELLEEDDFPFTRIPLPWQVDFFGIGIDNVYVSPNGALHTSPVAPCYGSFSILANNRGSSTVCNFNNSYYGIIAGFSGDLNPSALEHNLNITAAITDAFVTVQYTNVPYYTETYNNTFGMTIYNDSSILLYWNDVSVTGSGEAVVVGLRNYENNSLTTLTTSQLQSSQQWGTTVEGIYPVKADVISGSAFTLCPISTVWCATPSVLNVNSISTVVLRPLSISCLSKIDIVVYVLSSTTVSVTVDLSASSSSVAPCTTTAESTLNCAVSQLPSQYLVTSNITLGVAWRVSGSSTDAYQSMESITLDIRLSSAELATCSLNEDISTCNNACTLCSGNYTCLDLQCNNATDPVLYKYPVCNSSCYGTHSYHDYYLDTANDVCCLESQVDCFGVCNGTAVAAPYKGGVVNCCALEDVDCAGVCQGSSLPDACGVCGGTDYAGTGCSTGVHVYTNTATPNALNAYFSLADPNSVDAMYNINVSNTNSTSIYVEVSVHDDNAKEAPVMRVIKNSATIAGLQSALFPVNMSLTGLYNGSQSDWTVKELFVTSVREDSDKSLLYRIFVYPAVTDCSVVTDSSTCETMPACIFCDDFGFIRILREEHEEEGVGANTEQQSIKDQQRYPQLQRMRRLFPNLLPDQLQNVPDYVSGSCASGWNRTVCHASSFSTSAANANTRLTVVYFVGYAVMIVVSLLF
jgi:hypothetical protein